MCTEAVHLMRAGKMSVPPVREETRIAAGMVIAVGVALVVAGDFRIRSAPMAPSWSWTRPELLFVTAAQREPSTSLTQSGTTASTGYGRIANPSASHVGRAVARATTCAEILNLE